MVIITTNFLELSLSKEHIKTTLDKLIPIELFVIPPSNIMWQGKGKVEGRGTALILSIGPRGRATCIGRTTVADRPCPHGSIGGEGSPTSTRIRLIKWVEVLFSHYKILISLEFVILFSFLLASSLVMNFIFIVLNMSLLNIFLILVFCSSFELQKPLNIFGLKD